MQAKSQLSPAWVATSSALHSPAPLAWPTQQLDAQSALLRHWPVMNWDLLPLPTFWLPDLAESTGHVPDATAAAPPVLMFPAAGAAAGAATGGGAAAAGAGAALAPPSPKPQPVFPAALPTARPEQMPIEESPAIPAQQAGWAQSAVLLQAPVMNCFPAPLPTFLAPEGSGVMGWGVATARATTFILFLG